MIFRKSPWYFDYCRAVDANRKITVGRFLKDYIFQHRIRCVVYLRYAQATRSRLLRLYFNYRLYRLSRRFGLEIRSETRIGEGFCMIHPYNITISTMADIGRNCTIMKGATVGVSYGKYPGAPKIGDSVFIGLNATVLGGIYIGDDVLIAPNTLVNRDVPSHSVVLGNPCTIIPREEATKAYIFNKV